MKLNEFVEETLNSICQGIKAAKEHQNEENAIIAPGFVNGEIVTKKQYIDFEILLTVSENNQLQVEGSLAGRAGISGVIKGEGSASTNYTKNGHTGNSHKVSFSVPYVPEGIGYKSKNIKP
ncbi:hypothetical protein L3V83_14880 [Thiotrichales bacterium 19X7-9]|nr:hypothetical protein [Thiotrichales bacterium 19X7-9]